MTSIKDLMSKYKMSDKDKYVSREFQKYGYDLAIELGEPNKVPLYIKLAKTYPRNILEAGRSFVSDANNVKSKSRLFLWKIKKIKEENEKRKK